MPKPKTELEKVYQQVVEQGLLRTRDISIPSARVHLQRLCAQGKIQRVARGVYAPKNTKQSESSALSIISLKIPKGVLCLISALHFYDMTTHVPWEVWVAIPENAVTPRISEFHLKYVWYSEKMLSAGVESVTIDGVQVKIFNPAKTIADCFKYRNKIGLDVCLEALNEGWKRRLFTMDELWRYAKVCRVSTKIRPYLEALL